SLHQPAQLGHLALLRAMDNVLYGDAHGAVVALHVDTLDLDDVAEPLLQCTLHKELRRGDKLVAGRHEHKLRQPGSEGRSVDALARRGEEHLLDKIPNVLVRGGERGSSAAVDLEWIIEERHAAFTRICVATTFGG